MLEELNVLLGVKNKNYSEAIELYEKNLIEMTTNI